MAGGRSTVTTRPSHPSNGEEEHAPTSEHLVSLEGAALGPILSIPGISCCRDIALENDRRL